MKWLISLVVIAALGFFGFQYMNNKGATDAANAAAEAANQAKATAEAARDTATQALATAQDSMPAGIDLGKITENLDGIVGTASESLGGITDVASAEAALPALEDASGKLSGLADTIGRLPDAAKGPLGNIISGALASIKPLVEKAQSIPGVGDVITPVVTPMIEMLEGLST